MGFPQEAYHHTDHRMSLDEFIFGEISSLTSSYFMMKIESSRLIEEGILPGDFVVVERGVTPRSTDLVIASTNGSFIIHKHGLWKGPAFPQDYVLEAVVKAVVRKY